MKNITKNQLKALPKIHLCCANDESRPIMNHVLITKENIVASDAHVLICYKTKAIFPIEFIDAMPERFLIHRNSWRLMTLKHRGIIYKDNSIIIKYENYSLSIDLIDESVFGGKYPKWESVILKSDDLVAVDKIGINPEFLKKLSRAMFLPNECITNFRLELHDNMRAIMVYPLSENVDAFALIMPVMLKL